MSRPLDLIMPERPREPRREGCRKTTATRESHYGAGAPPSVPVVREDGRSISLKSAIVPLQAAQGGMTGTVVVMRDVTIRVAEPKVLKQRSARPPRLVRVHRRAGARRWTRRCTTSLRTSSSQKTVSGRNRVERDYAAKLELYPHCLTSQPMRPRPALDDARPEPRSGRSGSLTATSPER